MEASNEIKVWDVFVRLFHWVLAAAFFLAYATEGKPRWIHVNAGYLIGVLVVLRVLWGFIGSRHARFSDFIRSPREVFRHLKDVALFKARRYLGHDPAGGAMIVALLAFLSLTVISGMQLHGAKDKAGPFASLTLPALEQSVFADGGEKKRHGGEGKEERGEWLEEVHEVFANITLLLSLIHIGGVLLVSLETRENLIRGMISGCKRAPIDV